MDPHARWSERLSEYHDGDLAPDEARECASHVAACAECEAALAAIAALVLEAHALPATPPASDLWPAIAARLTPRDATAGAGVARPPRTLVLGAEAPWWRRRLSLSLPQALAAALLLVALAGGASWLALRPSPRTTPVATFTPPAPSPGPFTYPSPAPGGDTAHTASQAAPGMAVASVDPRYDRTVSELQRLFATQRAHLDTSTVRILDQNLAIIDRAVADAQRAVDSDPSNAYLRSHLAVTMRRKVQLLRRATVIAGAQG